MRVFEGFQKGVNLGGWISQCVSHEKEHFDTFITKSDISSNCCLYCNISLSTDLYK